MPKLMIYGANGYTGRLIAREAGSTRRTAAASGVVIQTDPAP